MVGAKDTEQEEKTVPLMSRGRAMAGAKDTEQEEKT